MSRYYVIPFFPYHQGQGEERHLVGLSRYIRGKRPGQPDVVQKLVAKNGIKLPTADEKAGIRCLVRAMPGIERFSPNGAKIEEYEFCANLPLEVEFEWDRARKFWSARFMVGRTVIVYRVREQDKEKLPYDGATCKVRWSVKPFHISYKSVDEDFFVVFTELKEELTAGRAIRRQIREGHRVEWRPGEGSVAKPQQKAVAHEPKPATADTTADTTAEVAK